MTRQISFESLRRRVAQWWMRPHHARVEEPTCTEIGSVWNNQSTGGRGPGRWESLE